MFALILCSIKHTFIHRTIWNTIANHSEFPLCFNAATVTTYSKFLHDKITQEFSKQNTSLLSYRKVQYFRLTCIVLVTNCMKMFWRQVPAYDLPKTLRDISPDRRVCLCFTEECYRYTSHSNAGSLTHSLQSTLGSLTGLKSPLLSETALFQVQYYSYEPL